MKGKSNADSLLAAIKRKAPEPVVAVKSAAANPSISNSGGRTHIWLTKADRKIIRELAAWLAGQGEKTTDSSILRSALRMAKPGGDLLQAFRESAKQDGRSRRG